MKVTTKPINAYQYLEDPEKYGYMKNFLQRAYALFEQDKTFKDFHYTLELLMFNAQKEIYRHVSILQNKPYGEMSGLLNGKQKLLIKAHSFIPTIYSTSKVKKIMQKQHYDNLIKGVYDEELKIEFEIVKLLFTNSI